MKKINQDSVERAFQLGAAREVTVVMRSRKEWYFTFVADDPLTEKAETFVLLTQRGQLRTWSDPRSLFAFLQDKCSVEHGKFILKEEVKNETTHSRDSG